MAGIPMYYGTSTFGGIEAKMARDRMDVLKTQEKDIEVDELVKAKELIKQEATKKLAEAKSARINPTALPEASQGMPSYNQPATSSSMPGLTPTVRSTDGTPMPAFNTGSAPSNAPTGASPMPSFMTGAKAEEAAKQPTQESSVQEQAPQEKTAVEGYRQPQQETTPQAQQQEEAPQSYINKAKAANLNYKNANDQVESAYKTAELFKQNGLLLQYQKQMKVAEELETSRSMAQERRIKSTKDIMDIMGGISGSYVDAARRTNDPVELDRAWNAAIMTMEANGLDTGNFKYIKDPQQRLQVAEVTMNASVEASAKLKLEQQALQEAGRNKRAQASLDLRQELGDKRLKQQARSQEAIQLRFDQSMDLRERTFAEGRIKTIVSQAQRDRSELNTELDDLNFKLNGIRTGQIMVDRAGNKLTKETRIQEVADIQKDINKIISQRDDISDEIKSYEVKFKDLGNSAKVKEGDTVKNSDSSKVSTEPVKTKANAPSQQAVDLVKAALKESPDKIALIKSNWERLHPGFKFEDYIK